MRTYEQVISELEEKEISPHLSTFFELHKSTHPLKKDFEKLFRFGQDFLDRTDLGFATDNARFFFSHREASNAVVRYEQGYYLIDIFRGTVEKINDFYSSRVSVLSDQRFSILQSVTVKLGIKMEDFFIQFTSLLYFYHEATHFIQQYNENDKKLSFTEEQKQQIKIPFQLLREFDADWYGAAKSVVHIGERVDNEKDFSELLIMSFASFFLFWVERSDIKESEMLSRNSTHPHPLIRLAVWIVSAISTAKSVFGYELDPKFLLNEAIKVAVLLENNDKKSKSSQMQKTIESKYQEIQDYIGDICDNSIHYPYLANNS